MTSNFFIRHSLVGFCLKILNSTVVIGLYYGFLTTACIGPSYLFLIRARVMEKGSETEIAATTGFLTGRVMMFISIYYAPLHLALNRPHTLTFLTLPYLFFNYVYQNDKHYYSGGWGWDSYPDSGYKNPNPNSIRNFRTYKVFLNNLFFQLLNPVLFPSSIFIRLMNIYLFRSNNKLLFLTSSFVGWLIGHIFLMKCIGLVLVWFKKKNSIKSKITMRFDKYILLQLRNYSGQLFIVFAFAIFARYSGRAVLPYVFSDEMTHYDERDMGEIEAAIDAEREENNEEDITVYFSENEKTSNNTNIQKKTKIVPPVERGLVSILFDYQQWIRPLRYIQNDHLERVVRDENSQFFFQTCESDGKKRISFTYPPHLSTFLNIMEKKMDLFRIDKTSNNDNELYNSWISRNKEKKNQLSNELFQRAKILDKKVKKGKKFNLVDVLENRVRLSDDRSRRAYLPKIYDPFLNGPARGEIQKSVSPLIKNETDTTNPILINKIHGLLLCMNTNSPELEQKMDKLDRKLVFTEMGFFFQLMSQFSEKSVSNFHFDELSLFPEHEQVKIYSEEKKRKRNLLFDAIRTNPFNHKTIFNRVLCSEIKEISKEVPRWNYELIDETELILEPGLKECQIRSPHAERVVLFNVDGSVGSLIGDNPYGNKYTETENPFTELAIPGYSRGPDFQRDLIRGSWRPLRRKTVTSKLFQGNGNVHSPIFLEMINNNPSFFLDALAEMWQYLKEYFRKLMKPGSDNFEFLAFQNRANEREKDQKEREEEYDEDEAANTLQRVEASWESILYGLVIRNFVLLFQSKFRKYILLPSLIITKNIIRMLLFQNPEWSEDFRDWERETHINCTYTGTPVYNNALPYQWVSEGLQIRVLFPFVLKAWHDKPKVRSTEKKRYTEKRFTEKRISQTHLWFLTAFGTVLESYPQEHVPNPFAFLGPILKQITKQLKKDLKKGFRKLENEREKKESRILLEEFKEIEIPKNSPISKSNPMIEESPLVIQSITEKRIKAAEKRIKHLNDKTKKILKEIEKMKKEEVITDPTRLELLKNSWKIFKRRNVRLIRKSSCFFQIFMERLYMDIVNMDIFNINYVGLMIDYVEHFLTSSIVQRYLNSIKLTIKLTRDLFELTKKMVNKSIYNKKNEQSIDKTNQSIIRFMSIIDKQKPWNITDMNSQNSCDVSSLSQGYVLFKLSQMPVSNGYKYKLRSILESPGRSFFLKNEIKDYLLKLQGGGRFNSKLRHKNRPDSIMNQWTNWLKIHYQYTLPQSAWSRLVPQKWRNTIHEHRVSQNKDLLEYDSSEKIQLIFSKKQKVDLLEQIDLLKNKKKIKKQYGYDLFAYQYINYVDKQKSYIYGYTSPCYNTPKNIKELFDIMGDSFIQNYISEDGILDEENKPDRKYCHWRQRRMGMNGKRRRGMNAKRRRMGMNGKSKKNSITNAKLLTPSFGFFSNIDAYKKNPWILPLNFLFRPFYGKHLDKVGVKRPFMVLLNFLLIPFYGTSRIIDPVEVALEKKEYEINNNLKLYLDKYYSVRRFPVRRYYDLNRFRKHLFAEKNFLIKKYWGGFFIRSLGDPDVEDKITWSTDLIHRMSRMKNPKQMLIASIKKGELDLDTFVRVVSDHTCFIEGRDIEEVKENLAYSVEPIRFSRNKNYEQSFLYQTISVSLKHKRQMLNSEKRRLDQKITENQDKNHYDLLVPENLLSPRRRRELRILICLNHRNRKTMDRNTIKEKEKKNSSEVLTKKKDLDSNTKKLRNLKFFLWPNYRFEDLACMNRYWFDTHNGSRFSILRIRMYPRLD